MSRRGRSGTGPSSRRGRERGRRASSARPAGWRRPSYSVGVGSRSRYTAASNSCSARSAGSLAWAGLFNTEFWIDPQRGVAATLLMQVLPFYDEGALRALGEFEAAVYRDLLPTPTE